MLNCRFAEIYRAYLSLQQKGQILFATPIEKESLVQELDSSDVGE